VEAKESKIDIDGRFEKQVRSAVTNVSRNTVLERVARYQSHVVHHNLELIHMLPDNGAMGTDGHLIYSGVVDKVTSW
jgi:hypothetical protein